MAVLDSMGRRNRVLDLTGMQFGRLKVLRPCGTRGRKRFWLCICACGKEKAVNASSLNKGITKSCGCLRLESVCTHRLSYSPEYSAWKGIRRRCCNPKYKMFKWYGGRGIKICKRWEKSFDAFIADVGPRPSAKHSIDRIDNNGNYEPGNVRWTTREVQDNNKQSSRFVEFMGERLTVQQWAKRLGIRFGTMKFRLARWGIERALTTPVQTAFVRSRQSRPNQLDGDKS